MVIEDAVKGTIDAIIDIIHVTVVFPLSFAHQPLTDHIGNKYMC